MSTPYFVLAVETLSVAEFSLYGNHQTIQENDQVGPQGRSGHQTQTREKVLLAALDEKKDVWRGA